MYLQEHPGKVGEYPLGAGVGAVAQIIEHVAHTATVYHKQLVHIELFYSIN